MSFFVFKAVSMATDKAQYSINKLHKKLRRDVVSAIEQYGMIKEGDRVMVCLSGGKDSYTLLDILLHLQQTEALNCSVIAVNLDQKQPGFPAHVLPDYLQRLGVDYHIIEQDTYSVVSEKIGEGKTMCSLCSRMRRGALYRTATELGATKIALGHHRDDMIETLFLNMFYGGKMKAMPPVLKSDDGEHVVIRPLALCSETSIARYAQAKAFPIIPCNLCGSQDNLQRQAIKEMLVDWQKHHPGRIENIFRAMADVVPSHLNDGQLFDFKQLSQETNGADIAMAVEYV